MVGPTRVGYVAYWRSNNDKPALKQFLAESLASLSRSAVGKQRVVRPDGRNRRSPVFFRPATTTALILLRSPSSCLFYSSPMSGPLSCAGGRRGAGEIILRTLAFTRENATEAARLLDLERGHFYKKMKALGIRRPRAHDAAEKVEAAEVSDPEPTEPGAAS